MKSRRATRARRNSVPAMRARLQELEETLRAIRSGEVDALVVSGRRGDRVFTLEGADFPFRMLIEQMGQGALTASPDGVITYANRRFADLFGCPLERVLGSSIYRFWSPSAADALRLLIARSKSTPAVAELTLARRSGPLPVQVSVNRLVAYDKPALLFVITDLTERRQREELLLSRSRLRRFNAELERRVRERTAELTAVNHDLEAFCYSASHDLRAPLRSISGFGDLLRRDLGRKLGEENRRRLNRMRDAALRMGDIIDALLSLSRLGRDEVHFEELDLTAMAEEIVAELRRAEPGRKASVRIARGLRAWGDRRLAKILLQNLFQNAWKFARPGRPVIEFSRVRGSRRDVFAVSDNGIGFDQEYADAIFQPFKRLHSREAYPGTGIGLSLARRIAVRHDGWIRAEGRTGKGATFLFTLAERPGGKR